MKGFYGMAEAMTFQNKPTIDVSRSLWSRALSKIEFVLADTCASCGAKPSVKEITRRFAFKSSSEAALAMVKSTA